MEELTLPNKIEDGMAKGGTAIEENFEAVATGINADRDAAADTGWQDLTLLTDWAADAVPNGTPQIRKVGSRVYLRGVAKGSKLSDIAKLPYLPKAESGFVCSQRSADPSDVAKVYVELDGRLAVVGAVDFTRSIFLDTISYFTEE